VFDVENQVRFTCKMRPEVFKVLDLIQQHGRAFATGHSTPAETMMLLEEARKTWHRTHRRDACDAYAHRHGRRLNKASRGCRGVHRVRYNGLIVSNKQFTIRAVLRPEVRSGASSSDLGQAHGPLLWQNGDPSVRRADNPRREVRRASGE
jgi:hypothetical protein